MIRGLAGAALIVLAVVAAGFVAQRLFGSDGDHPLSGAREAVETLPYGVTFEKSSSDVLVGTVQGHLGVVVHFVVTESGAKESRSGQSTDSKVQRQERRNIAGAIDEALCRKSIGQGCPS